MSLNKVHTANTTTANIIIIISIVLLFLLFLQLVDYTCVSVLYLLAGQ